MLKKIRFSLLTAILVLTMSAGLLTSCEEGGTIKIPYVDWACAEAEAFLAQEILTHMGYQVELNSVSAGVMWESIATGDQDFITTAWLPYTHQSYWETHQDNVDRIGTLYEGAVLALVVPEYVTIDSITELNDHKEEFGGRIVGIDPGAGIMEATKNTLMPHYGLDDWELIESSDAAMKAELDSYYNNEDWIVVTGWAPHWKFAAYDLKILEDPDETLGGLEEIVIVARQGFRDDFPEVSSFLENWTLTADQLGEIMYMISVDGMAPAVAARTWIDNNQDAVNSWLP